MWEVNSTTRLIYPLARPGTHCTGWMVSPRDGLGDEENLSPTGFDFRAAYPVASRYTD